MRRSTIILLLVALVSVSVGSIARGSVDASRASAEQAKTCKKREHGKIVKVPCLKPRPKPKPKKPKPKKPATPKPTTTTAAPAPPPPAPGTTRTSPIPIGTPAAISVLGAAGWTLEVNSVIPDDTTAVLAANMFNSPPAAGHQFFLISLTATYTGTGSSNGFAVDSSLNAVGASNVSYTLGTDTCGVLPDPDFMLVNDAKTVFSGGSISGNICFSVTNTDAATLELFTDASLPGGTGPTWFALH